MASNKRQYNLTFSIWFMAKTLERRRQGERAGGLSGQVVALGDASKKGFATNLEHVCSTLGGHWKSKEE